MFVLVNLYILHNIIGITDRVVNQLLTLLDGVEATMSASGNRTSTLYSCYDSGKDDEGNCEGERDGAAGTGTTTGDNKNQKVTPKTLNTPNTNHAKAVNDDDDEDSSSGGEVYILAATSRPDLVDPALLRPGRIDRHIFLSYPTPEDRYAILQTIYANSIPTSSTTSTTTITSNNSTNNNTNNNITTTTTNDTNNNNNTTNSNTTNNNTINDILYKIAYDKHSDYFSVSDLQSIFTIAHLTLIQRYMTQQEERERGENNSNINNSINNSMNITNNTDNYTDNNTNSTNNTKNITKNVDDSSINFSLQLTSEDIWHAYTTIKPSLLLKDRLNFKYIYEKFQGLNEKGQNYDGCSEVEDGKKSENEDEDISAVYLEMKRQLGTKTSMM